jgi:hypothetical protein
MLDVLVLLAIFRKEGRFVVNCASHVASSAIARFGNYARVHLVLVILGLFVAQISGCDLVAQTSVETIRGRVLDDSARAIYPATIIAIMAPSRTTFSTNTDSTGRFRIDVPEGTGDYLVHIQAIDFEPVRRRLIREPGVQVLEVNVTLTRKVQKLQPVSITSVMERPTRGSALVVETGGTERTIDGINGVVDPGRQGDLAAMASMVPGVSLTPQGPSVLGLAPSQTQFTLNGLSFSGSSLPRDVVSRTRVYTSTYDASRGGFGGAQIDAELSPGAEFTTVRSRLVVNAPQLQQRVRGLPQDVNRYTRFDIGLAGNGQFLTPKTFYNGAIQATQTTSATRTLAQSLRDASTAFDLPLDTVSKFVSEVNELGIPTYAQNLSHKVTRQIVGISRIDYSPFESRVGADAKQTWSITAFGRYQITNGVTSGVLPTVGAENSREAAGTLQLLHAKYWGREYLTENRISFSANSVRNGTESTIPTGLVDVFYDPAVGTGGVSTLRFGGNGFSPARQGSWTWESVSETMLYPKHASQHRLKIFLQSRLEGYDERGLPNNLGTFTYASLTDLALNMPSSFSRTLGNSRASSSSWDGALGLGDLFSISPRLKLLYGLRLEANRFTSHPTYLPEVGSSFGVTTSHLPSNLMVLPRFGFTWIRTGQDRSGVSSNSVATVYRAPTGSLRGGVGAFRNRLPASLVAQTSLGREAVTSTRHLLCVGSATPHADWQAFDENVSAVPTACINDARSFADDAPTFTFFGTPYRNPTSWRGNLAWTSSARKFDYTLEGIVSFNVNQGGNLDLNLVKEPRFYLTNEGNRSVYVPTSDIVPETGLVGSTAMRVVPRFGKVLQLATDNRSVSQQLIFSLTAPQRMRPPDLFIRGSYVVSRVRNLSRGFDGVTFGDPRRQTWARADYGARHRLQVEAAVGTRWFTLSGLGNISSGIPFTPVVNGDINGDGTSYNDAAFIFDPATLDDSALRSEMQSLFQALPTRTRSCLTRHLGRPAERNMCETPWTVAMNAQLNAGPALLQRIFGAKTATTVSIFLNNPVGGLDRLIHGRNTRGWGGIYSPDPFLLKVVAFDPDKSKFQYSVNPRFGRSALASSAFTNPFRVTLDISIPLNRPIGEQQIDRWLKPGRAGRSGNRLNADSLKRRYRRSLPDFYARIIDLSDSLLLSREQVERLQADQAKHRQQMDSLWSDLAKTLADLPDNFDTKEAFRLQEAAIDAAWELSRQRAKTLNTILGPIQLSLLPWPASLFYRAEKPLRGLRIFN